MALRKNLYWVKYVWDSENYLQPFKTKSAAYGFADSFPYSDDSWIDFVIYRDLQIASEDFKNCLGLQIKLRG